MPTLEIHALSELRGEAAELLRERYARQRAAEPLLSEVEDFEPLLPEDGLVATRNGAAVAYLAGAVEQDVGWVRFAGCAASEPEALRDLFAELAAGWDVTRFQVAVPAADEALRDVFFRLAFGCQAVWAIREPEEGEPVDFGGTIRRATEDDLEAALDLIAVLFEHQAATPSFSGFATPSREERLRKGSSVSPTIAGSSFLRSATAVSSVGSASTAAPRAICASRPRTSTSPSPRPWRTSAAAASGSRSPSTDSPGRPSTAAPR